MIEKAYDGIERETPDANASTAEAEIHNMTQWAKENQVYRFGRM